MLSLASEPGCTTKFQSQASMSSMTVTPLPCVDSLALLGDRDRGIFSEVSKNLE